MNQETNSSWRRDDLKDPHRAGDKRRRVRAMFSGIAGSYDLLNHLLSLNLDRRWRRRAVQLARVGPGQSVLDLCCGTGDLALEFARSHPDLAEIIGVDFAPPMLEIAAQKSEKLSRRQRHDRCNNIVFKWLCQDVEHLDLGADRFDCVSCAFGVRNLQDLPTGLKNIFHLLKPGGRVVILEFALPRNRLLGWGYACYFRLVLPVIGSIIAADRNGAYHYLPASVATFDAAVQIDSLLRKFGFTDIRIERLSAGAVLAFVALKP